MTDVQAARSRLDVPGDATCVLVFGGSLGARSINLAAVDGARAALRCTCCTSAASATTGSCPPGSCAPGYDLREYLDRDQFADALAAADLVVARQGGSVFEIAAQGLPSVLSPIRRRPATTRAANARWMADAGAAVVIDDGELTGPSLGSAVGVAAGRPGRLAAMAPGGPGASPARMPRGTLRRRSLRAAGR